MADSLLAVSNVQRRAGLLAEGFCNERRSFPPILRRAQARGLAARATLDAAPLFASALSCRLLEPPVYLFAMASRVVPRFIDPFAREVPR